MQKIETITAFDMNGNCLGTVNKRTWHQLDLEIRKQILRSPTTVFKDIEGKEVTPTQAMKLLIQDGWSVLLPNLRA